MNTSDFVREFEKEHQGRSSSVSSLFLQDAIYVSRNPVVFHLIMDFFLHFSVIWLDIHQKIRSMIRSVFDSAATVHPDMHSSMSRAIYGVDVMLDSCFMPKLLEVNMLNRRLISNFQFI